jgi:hypothetical protein
MSQAYRRSIWKQDQRYQIDVDHVSTEALNKIGIVQSIEAAKKQTPPIPFRQILEIVSSIERLPDSAEITVADFEVALRKMDSWGAGLKTLICILSVLTNGRYPPLDRKIAKAARLKGIINDIEERALNATRPKKVAEIYVTKLVPRWLFELQNAASAESLDNEWARLAEDN